MTFLFYARPGDGVHQRSSLSPVLFVTGRTVRNFQQMEGLSKHGKRPQKKEIFSTHIRFTALTKCIGTLYGNWTNEQSATLQHVQWERERSTSYQT